GHDLPVQVLEVWAEVVLRQDSSWRRRFAKPLEQKSQARRDVERVGAFAIPEWQPCEVIDENWYPSDGKARSDDRRDRDAAALRVDDLAAYEAVLATGD